MEKHETNNSDAALPGRDYRVDVPDSLPEGLSPSDDPAARAHFTEGEEALAAGDLKAAAAAFRAAIAADRNAVRAHHNLGVVCYRLEDWEGARACFEQSLALAPGQADLHYRAGLCGLRQGRPDEALKAFTEAAAQEPNHLEAQFQIALLHARRDVSGPRGRQRAIEMLRHILSSSEGGGPGVHLDRVCFLLGSFLDDTPEGRDEAIAVYRRGIDVDPLFAPGHNNLGVLLMQSGQTISALGAFKIAIHLEPDYALPYQNLARLFFDHMGASEMEREYATLAEEFGVRAPSVLTRISLELIDLGRAQVYESLYSHGHQIKNLMGMVGSRTRRLIRRAPADGPQLDGLKAVAREQERVYDQWVAYLRSMKQDAVNPTLVDVPNLVRRSVEASSVRKETAELSFVSEGNVPQVKADPAMLNEAVTNLILNALEAVEASSGEVSVQTGYDRDRTTVYIEIEDNGPGIPRDLQARIFDPGYTTKKRGNGYGLSLCSRIVSAHRGTVRLISQEGAGTVFRIDLPTDFELVSEEASVGLLGSPVDTSRAPIVDEFIE